MPKVNIKPLDTSSKIYLLTAVSMISILLMFIGTVRFLNAINEFFDNNYLAFHKVIEVELESPITIEARRPMRILSPLRTVETAEREDKPLTIEERKEIVKDSPYSAILEKIWKLESNNGEAKQGHHTSCKEMGMSNEFGYDALNGYCFYTFKQSVEVVSKWIEEELMDNTLTQMLCKYNTGRSTDSCVYSENFISMK